MTIRSVPLKIEGRRVPHEIDIRGGVDMDLDSFERKIRNKIDEVWGRETQAKAEGEILMAAEGRAKYGK